MRISCAEKVLDWSPLLTDNVELVLHRVSIHDVGQDGEFFIIVEIFERIRQDLPISVDHQDVDFFVPCISLIGSSVPKQDAHSTAFVLKLLEPH